MARRRSAAPLAGLCALLMLGACSDLRGTEAQRKTAARIMAENAVLIASHIPRSIVFRNEQVLLRDDGPVVCGEFNGKTRRGEMAGFARYIVVGEQLLVDEGQPEFDARWREACAFA